MAISDDKWFEIWYSEGVEVIPYYLLIVTTDEKDRGKIIVIDPLKSNQVVYRGKDYEEVCHWLSEDEYEQVEGRMFPDDGW